MRRSITTLSLAAAALLALSSCATPDHTSHGATPVAQAGTPSTHSEHSPSSPPSAGASPSASAEHSEHSDTIETYDGTNREKPHPDDTYSDVKLEDGTTYTIQSSTGGTEFKLTIESFDCKDPFPQAGITASGKAARFKADDGKTLCVAMVSGENIGKQPDHAALNYFVWVVSEDGTKYEETDSPDFTTQFLVEGKTPLDQPVDPGDTGWIALGYELPVGTTDVSLRINTAPTDG